MVLKSEAGQLKLVGSPARDRKYTLVAYSRLLVEFCQTMPPESTTELVRGLIDACNPARTAFKLAAQVEKSVED